MDENPTNIPTNQVETPKPKSRFPSAFDLFKPAFDSLMLNIMPLLFVIFVPGFLVGMLGGLLIVIAAGAGGNNTFNIFLWLSYVVVFIAFLLVVMPAIFYLQLAGAKNRKVSIGETIEQSLRYMFRILGLSIIVGFIVAIGLILFIVPGLFMLKRYLLSPYYLIERDMKIFDAMQESKRMAEKYPDAIWGVVGTLALISALGTLSKYIPIVGVLVYIFAIVINSIYGYAPALRFQQIKALEPRTD